MRKTSIWRCIEHRRPSSQRKEPPQSYGPKRTKDSARRQTSFLSACWYKSKQFGEIPESTRSSRPTPRLPPVNGRQHHRERMNKPRAHPNIPNFLYYLRIIQSSILQSNHPMHSRPFSLQCYSLYSNATALTPDALPQIWPCRGLARGV
jgi:hypothetical protein